jgi:N-acyl-D-aspartate/D-glutamate deacylase
MGYDWVIRGATLIDGTGGPSREGDLAIEAGRIAEIGRVAGRGREELDGRGRVLAPGFIDPHTHLDANLFWDPDLTPSSSFGVTSVVTGNCGYTFAPIEPATRDYVVAAMSTVEQIPRETIEAAVPFDWSDLDSYMARLERLPCLLNHATLVGHVPVRAAVMGSSAACRRVASTHEAQRMAALVARGLELGALGFSTDQVVGNFGPDGTDLPGQVCDEAELLAIARALRGAPGPGIFAMANRALLQDRAERERDLDWHERLAAASGRAVVVGPVFDHFDDPGVGVDLMDRVLEARARGRQVIPQISTRPFELWTRLDYPGILVQSLPSLLQAQRGGRSALRALARDPVARAQLRKEGDRIEPTLIFSGRWEHVFVRLTRPEHAARTGPSLADQARARGCHPVDVLLDLADAEDFETQFATVMRNADDGEVARLVAHPAAMIGASDAGAHTLMNTDSCYAVWTLQHWVRERRVLTLERAVRMLTADQADLLGLGDRGRLVPGLAADLVLFEPDRVAATGVRYRNDQPGGGARLVPEASGIAASFVNGVLATRDGQPTGARAGRLLRPGVAAAHAGARA